MAASKTHFGNFARSNYRFLSTTHDSPIRPDQLSELDESDIWNTTSSNSSDFRKPISTTTTRISRKYSSPATGAGTPASLPVTVPDWSKILKEEYNSNRRSNSDDDDDFSDDGIDGSGNRIPPHELLARQMARTRIASFSVHEGIGRTLKGRDLSMVRNAIWEKTGFQD